MISVCIPVYNLDVRELVNSLREQACDIRTEIILIDDASEDRFRELNRTLKDNLVSYHQLNENVGRSRIRNLFTGYAEYKNLLFLDCDSIILSDRFLCDYAAVLNTKKSQVICGGRIYPEDPPSNNKLLHWKYGRFKESKTAEERSKDPNRSFMTNNFVVSKDLVETVHFDERLSRYGHEDSLFGFQLSKKGIKITHINNPVLHNDLQSNREFIEKTRDAVHNLVFINKSLNKDPGFVKSIRLLTAAEKIKQRGLSGIIRFAAYLFNPLISILLRSGITSLSLLNFYKLGLYLRLEKKQAGPL